MGTGDISLWVAYNTVELYIVLLCCVVH